VMVERSPVVQGAAAAVAAPSAPGGDDDA